MAALDPRDPLIKAMDNAWHIQVVKDSVASERERCAKIAEKFARQTGSVNGREAARKIASLIRED